MLRCMQHMYGRSPADIRTAPRKIGQKIAKNAFFSILGLARSPKSRGRPQGGPRKLCGICSPDSCLHADIKLVDIEWRGGPYTHRAAKNWPKKSHFFNFGSREIAEITRSTSRGISETMRDLFSRLLATCWYKTCRYRVSIWCAAADIRSAPRKIGQKIPKTHFFQFWVSRDRCNTTTVQRIRKNYQKRKKNLGDQTCRPVC
jgi:hypothetical protein